MALGGETSAEERNAGPARSPHPSRCKAPRELQGGRFCNASGSRRNTKSQDFLSGPCDHGASARNSNSSGRRGRAIGVPPVSFGCWSPSGHSYATSRSTANDARSLGERRGPVRSVDGLIIPPGSRGSKPFPRILAVDGPRGQDGDLHGVGVSAPGIPVETVRTIG
jgi:hypothetical protein